MLDELVGQVRRLFSSKNNGSRLVFKLTDRLHYYKQVLLATSIVLLLGYSQFRAHFVCQGLEKIDAKTLTNFCWINGTHTLDLKSPTNSSSKGKQITSTIIGYDDSSYGSLNLIKSAISSIPHVGMHFKPGGKAADKYVLVGHNYMHSLWALLILMAVCSFVAQRKWSSIFRDDVLKALLKLPGHKDLTIVAKAQEARAYEKLMKLPGLNEEERMDKYITLMELFKGSQLSQTVEILVGEENEYNRLLEYYPNQLIYLLMTKRTRSYKLSALNLKRSLIIYSINSFCLTLMQFILPLLFIGDKYFLYGWQFFKAWLGYAASLWTEISSSATSEQNTINSIEYKISGQIWPVSTLCDYTQFGYQGVDKFTVQCTVPINEICAKLFFVIWWFVVINVVVEFCSLCSVLISSTSFNWTKFILGRRYWPNARREARAIAGFRYKHALALDEQLKRMTEIVDGGSNVERDNKLDKAAEAAAINKAIEEVKARNRFSEHQRKALEARVSRSRGHLLSGHSFIGRHSDKDLNDFENKSPKDDDGFSEKREDSDIYYLFYLLHLRLGNSQARTEQVLRMTEEALSRYLASLSKLEQSRSHQNYGDGNQLAASTGSGRRTSMSSLVSDSSDRATVVNVS